MVGEMFKKTEKYKRLRTLTSLMGILGLVSVFSLTMARFIEHANKVHKGRYDYSREEFTNVERKIEIS